MAKNDHQHVVPRLHLRHFSHKKGRADFVWAHEYGQIPKEISLRDAAVRKNAYSTRKSFDSEYQTGNEDALKKIETAIAPLYRKIIDNRSVDNLSSDERFGFSAFVILMSERNPNNFVLVDQMMKDLHMECWEEGVQKMNDEEMQKIFEEVKEKNPDMYKSVTFEEAKNWMIEGPKQRNIVFTHSHGIRSMWEAAVMCAPMLMQLGWQLLEPKNQNQQFCTSDDPVVNTVEQNGMLRVAKGGWGQSSLEVTFPLTPNLCLAMANRVQTGCHKVSEEMVEFINELTVVQSFKYVYTKDLTMDAQLFLKKRAKIQPDFTQYERLTLSK